MTKRRWCGASPRPDSIDRSGTPARALCLCGRPLTFVDGLRNQASHWRHHPKARVQT